MVAATETKAATVLAEEGKETSLSPPPPTPQSPEQLRAIEKYLKKKCAPPDCAAGGCGE